MYSGPKFILQPDTSNWNSQRARSLYWSQAVQGGFLIIQDDLPTFVVAGNDAFDFSQWQILLELDGETLRMATHCADTHALSVDGDEFAAVLPRILLVSAMPFHSSLV